MLGDVKKCSVLFKRTMWLRTTTYPYISKKTNHFRESPNTTEDHLITSFIRRKKRGNTNKNQHTKIFSCSFL